MAICSGDVLLLSVLFCKRYAGPALSNLMRYSCDENNLPCFGARALMSDYIEASAQISCPLDQNDYMHLGRNPGLDLASNPEDNAQFGRRFGFYSGGYQRDVSSDNTRAVQCP